MPVARETSTAYCRRTVRRGDRDRYLTALFAPAARRDDVLALAAFNLEIARIREQVSEPMLGMIRLQWWREILDQIYGGTAPRRHPVAEALAEAIRRHGLSRAPFEQLLDARERDMAPMPNADMAALERYARDTSAPLLDLMLQALAPAAIESGKSLELTAALQAAGAGYALVGLLRAVPFHAASGRSYLPSDRMAEAGLTVQDLVRSGPVPARERLMRAVADRARYLLEQARPTLGQLPRAAAPVRLSAALARWHLDRVAKSGFDPGAPSVQSAPPWTVWRLGWWHLTGRT